MFHKCFIFFKHDEMYYIVYSKKKTAKRTLKKVSTDESYKNKGKNEAVKNKV